MGTPSRYKGRVSQSFHTVYGTHPVKELISAKRRRIQKIFILPKHEMIAELEKQHMPLEKADRRALEALAPDAVHQGIVARVDPYPYFQVAEIVQKSPERHLLLALDCISDPQNFGTLCRSALAFGVSGIIIPQDRSVMVTPVVCKASAGTVEHLHIARVVNLVRALEECKKAGYWIYGAAARDAEDLAKLAPAGKSVVVLGSEGDGLRSLVQKTCDVRVKIEMKDRAESLNVAQAGSILLYEFAKKIGIL